jgi:hypothetical protein
MVMQFGVGAFAAGLFHIVGHALYKAAMFLGAGGAISAHSRQVQRPHLGAGDTAQVNAPATRLAIGLIVPLVAFGAALWVIDPHLTAAATILVVSFGALSVGRAANGWISSAPFGAARTIATAIAGIVVVAFGYVGGLTVFEGFVVDVVPYDVPAAVGPVWVGAILAGIGAGVALVGLTPGPRGDAVRRQVYAWLLSTSTPVTATRNPSPASASQAHATSATTDLAPELATAGDPA